MRPHKTILIIMISVKMMKSAAIRNLQEYGTTEHIFGLGMATKETEAAFSAKKAPRSPKQQKPDK